jgi:hypothetical protein
LFSTEVGSPYVTVLYRQYLAGGKVIRFNNPSSVRQKLSSYLIGKMALFQQNPFEQPMMLGSSYESFDGGAGSPTASPCLTIPALSRRGSACSNASSSSEMSSYGGESMETLTPEHHMLLERQFSETRKPAVKVRRALAEQAGLSVQVISVSLLYILFKCPAPCLRSYIFCFGVASNKSLLLQTCESGRSTFQLF